MNKNHNKIAHGTCHPCTGSRISLLEGERKEDFIGGFEQDKKNQSGRSWHWWKHRSTGSDL